VPQAVFEPAIPASELPQTQAAAPPGLANLDITFNEIIKLLCEISSCGGFTICHSEFRLYFAFNTGKPIINISTKYLQNIIFTTRTEHKHYLYHTY